MVGSLLVRGMLVGIIAGFLAFGFAKIFGEPHVDSAIAFESLMEQKEAHEHAGMPGMEAQAAHAEEEPELVSRGTQSGIGLLTGVVIYGAAFGGLFSLVFAFLQGRVGRVGPRALAALLAAAGFIAIVVVPDLKYPANPPAVGNGETITYRTEMFFAMLAISIGAMALAVVLARRLMAQHGLWNASLIAAGAFILVIAVAQLLLPEINEVPEEFPAVLLWRFRIAAVGMQLVLWATLGLLFGWLTERSTAQRFRFSRA